MQSCYNLYSCDSQSYPDILYITDPILATYLGETIIINGDSTKKYTVGATKQLIGKTVETPVNLYAGGILPVTWRINSILYNGVEQIVTPPTYVLNAGNVVYLDCTGTTCSIDPTPTNFDANYTNEALFLNSVFTGLNLPLKAFPISHENNPGDGFYSGTAIAMPENATFEIVVERISGPLAGTLYTYSLDSLNTPSYTLNDWKVGQYVAFSTRSCLDNLLGITTVELAQCSCGTCAEGLTFNPETGLCDGFEIVPTLCSGTIYVVQGGNQIPSYGFNGARFFENATNRPFPLIETNVGGINDDAGTPLNLLSTVQSTLWGDTSSSLNGRLNQAGVWTNASNGNPANEWIGFTACVNVPVEQVYCIGIAADNYVRFRIDGQLIFTGTTGSIQTFRNWYVIPITLSVGTHNIELEGLNLGSSAAFAAEIYQADTAALALMTTIAELEAVTIFSSGDQIGEAFDLGEESGCHCPDGYALSACNGTLECVQFFSEPFTPCPCWLATNCKNPADAFVINFTDLGFTPDLSLVYTFTDDPSACYSLQEVDCKDETPVTVTVEQSYENCTICQGTCYELRDCESQELFIVNINLSAYLFKVIRVEIIIDGIASVRCFTVSPITCIDEPDVLVFTILDCFDSCIDCVIPEPPKPPLVVKNRSVRPGWFTKGCPPEYVEKVSCEFAETMYQEVASIRYGIQFCCERDYDKWVIKKQLLDLKAIEDPEACVPPPCQAPCNLTAEIEFNCMPARYLLATITIP